jgi:hypothetical protein
VLLLAGKPPVQAMFMIAVAALTLCFLASNAWIVEQRAVGAGNFHVFSADAATDVHGVTHAVCDCVPLMHCINCLRSR